MEMATTQNRSWTTDKLRAEYRKIRARSHCEDNAKFDAAVEALIEKTGDRTPAGYVRAAKEVVFPCRRCAGTGAFITGTLNGQPTGPGGDCLRCGGKGTQNARAARRNYGADMH